jgi:stage II sporulation protein D
VAANQEDIRVGLLFGNSATASIAMNRFEGGSFELPGNPIPLFTVTSAGSQNFSVTPGGASLWGWGSFSSAAEALTAVSGLEAFEPVPVWNQGWLLWLKGDEAAIRQVIGKDTLVALSAPQALTVTIAQQRFHIVGAPVLHYIPGGEFTQVVNKNRTYRGIMEIRLANNRLTLINQLPLEQYLLGVVPWEMSPSWHLEALKAQAVAARTYALANWYKFHSQGFNVCDTTNSQAYYGYSASHETARVREAVNSTAGEVVMHRNRIINTVYHANCGGFTEDARNAWGTRVEYLLGRECGYCAGTPRNSWTYQTVITGQDSFGRSGFQDLLRQAGRIPPDFVIDRIEPFRQYTEAGFPRRMSHVVLTDPTGRQVSLSGALIANLLNNPQAPGPVPENQRMWSSFFALNTDADFHLLGSSTTDFRHGGLSQLFVARGDGSRTRVSSSTVTVMTAQGRLTMSARPANISFPGGGWGHGVGMCQWGARRMAEQGYNYRQILQYYYSGIEVR